MSCAAADVMSDPADCMAGCMRGASESRLKYDPGEGKVKELAITADLICSTDDCIMSASDSNSAKVSFATLQMRILSTTSNRRYMRDQVYLAVEGRPMGAIDCGDKKAGSGTENDIVDDDKRAALSWE